MKITREEVEHVARLARLTLDENELKKMTSQLDDILSYVEKLDELETEDIPPMTHALAISNAFREDEVVDSLPQEEALANCEKQNGETFIVPRII